MQALARLLQANSDPSDTRYNILNEAEVDEIEESIECEVLIDRMQQTYERKHP